MVRTDRQGWTAALGVVTAAAMIGTAQSAHALAFDGVSDNGTNKYGYYYTVSGSQFPTGSTPDGTRASGGTYRYVADNPVDWGRSASQAGIWQTDNWFSDTAGLALTLRGESNQIVYDNNGLESDAATPADPTFYDTEAGNYPQGGHGAHVAYSMSNNWDFIYAGYFKLEADTLVTSLTGYFNFGTDPASVSAGFDPASPFVSFRMNIWSNVENGLDPTNTGSFDGDVFTSDLTAGTFAWEDTGFDRVGSATTDDIYRLTYTLDTPLTLAAGEYWFSHDVALIPTPAMIVPGMLMFGLLGLRRRQRAEVAA